jgi:hypothetical protein
MLTAMPCVSPFGGGAGDCYSIASRQLSAFPDGLWIRPPGCRRCGRSCAAGIRIQTS